MRENDSQFEEVMVSKVEGNKKNGWVIERSDGWSFAVPKDSPIIPKVGMKACFYGKGMGYTVRGLLLDGVQVFYRTEEEQKIKDHSDYYGKDLNEWLERWDKGDSVWSIEMGGLGPGYEQALQITCVEIVRLLLKKKYDCKKWEDPAVWGKDREEIEKIGLSNKTIKGLGISGAQWGAAFSLAIHFYRQEPIGVMTDEKVKDRHIQISKNFPKG